MNIIIALIISLIAGFSTMIGGLFIFIPKFNQKHLIISLSFTLVIMIGVSLFDLIPNGLPIIYAKYNYFSIFIIFILLICSLIFIKIITGINREEKGGLYRLGIMSMFILIIHNLPEGIITFLTSYIDYKIGIKLAIAICLHNIPEGIAIAIPIYYATNNKKKALLNTLYASIAEPIGAILAFILLKDYINSYNIGIILIIVAGLMIGLSINEIVPSINRYNNKKSIITGIILGIIVILIGIILN